MSERGDIRQCSLRERNWSACMHVHEELKVFSSYSINSFSETISNRFFIKLSSRMLLESSDGCLGFVTPVSNYFAK